MSSGQIYGPFWAGHHHSKDSRIWGLWTLPCKFKVTAPGTLFLLCGGPKKIGTYITGPYLHPSTHGEMKAKQQ